MYRPNFVKKAAACASAAAVTAVLLSLACNEDNSISKAFYNKREAAAEHLTDSRDGQAYRTVAIGSVQWMAENINYRTPNSECYGKFPDNCRKYGRLYTWQEAAMSACPSGWHLPTNAEWNDLIRTAGDYAEVLRSKEWEGTDIYGWSAMPGGLSNLREDNTFSFGYAGSYAVWWSLSESNNDIAKAYIYQIEGDDEEDDYNLLTDYVSLKANRKSVRCVKDGSGATRRYIVTFETDGGMPAYIPARGVESGRSLGDWFPDNPQKSGSAFDGWFDGDIQYTENTTFLKNTTLTARWRSVPKYTVSFNTNGGTPATIAPVQVDSGLTLGSQMPKDPARTANTFMGWYETDGEKETQYAARTVITKDVTLSAKWYEWPKYTVTFDANGGSPGSIPPVSVDSGTAIGNKLPDDPQKAGSAFYGWFYDDTPYNYKSIIVRDIKLTAQWAKEVLFDARDSTRYKTVKIGTQTWMAENLKYAPASGSWCHGGHAANCAKYGRLYDWNTAMANAASSDANPSGVKGVCPNGWHLPSSSEWIVLAKNADGTGTYGAEGPAGKKLKSKSGWQENGEGTDDLEFNILPGGFRDSSGTFGGFGYHAYFWAATIYTASDGSGPVMRAASYNLETLRSLWNRSKKPAYSVRCVSDR